jgi:hypothetical protein
MRPIKFRAWDKLSKSWVPGGYGFHILGESLLIGGLFQNMPLEMLNDIDLTQFTGLKDIHGIEVYEGDIIRHPGSELNCDRGTVFWNEHFAMFGVKIDGTDYELWDGINMSGMEVCGNIYEPKEKNNGNPDGNKGNSGSEGASREPGGASSDVSQEHRR